MVLPLKSRTCLHFWNALRTGLCLIIYGKGFREQSQERETLYLFILELKSQTQKNFYYIQVLIQSFFNWFQKRLRSLNNSGVLLIKRTAHLHCVIYCVYTCNLICIKKSVILNIYRHRINRKCLSYFIVTQ